MTRTTNTPAAGEARPESADSASHTSQDPAQRGSEVAARVPLGWRLAAAYTWRGLVLLLGLGVLGYLVGYLALLVIPIAVALLLAALLQPVVARLVRWRLPRPAAVAAAIVGGLIIIGGVLTGVINAVLAGLPGLQAQLGRSIQQINGWLANGPLNLSPHALQNLVNQALAAAKANQTTLLSGAVGTVSSGATALALTIFTLIFFLHDGARIWRFVTRIVPTQARAPVQAAGQASFAGLIHYVRATILVAAGDAIGIGIGLFAVGVPLAIPLAAVVFLGAFIPIAGTVTAGIIAVLVTLVTNGPVAGVIMLAVVIVVMQLEGDVLQPLLLGHALRLHPLAVVLAITLGTITAGIAGALLSVPLLTVLVSGTRHLQGTDTSTSTDTSRRRWFPRLRRGHRPQQQQHTQPAPDPDSDEGGGDSTGGSDGGGADRPDRS